MLLKRGLAFFVDILTVALGFSAATVVLQLTFSDLERVLFLFSALGFYFTLFLWLWNGRTPGSFLLSLRVQHPKKIRLAFKDALLRAIGIVVSYLLFGFGFMLALVRLDSKNLPDLLSGTASVEI